MSAGNASAGGAGSDPARWQSLAPLLGVARRTLGDREGPLAVARWFGEQLGRVDDPAFATLFAEHIDLPGIDPGDFAHRVVDGEGLRALGGIRFFGGDVARPFVEIVAWTRLAPEGGTGTGSSGDGGGGEAGGTTENAADDRIGGDVAGVGEGLLDDDTGDRLRQLVAREWCEFTPPALRLACTPGGGTLGERARSCATLDVTVHGAVVDAMPAPDGVVTLRPFADAAEAVRLVDARFAALHRDAPALARDVTAASAKEIAEWHARGTLHAIVREGTTVGVIATVAGAIDWLAGDVIGEEVVAVEHAGQGYAASAQRALAARLAGTGRRLIGTIDGRNVASRRSAERAGRGELWRHVFLPTP